MKSINNRIGNDPKETEEEIAMAGIYRLIGFHHVQSTAEELDEITKKCQDMTYPKELDQWFQNYMNKSIKEEKRRERRSSWYRYSSRVAVFILLFSIAVVTMTLSVEAIRVRVLNFFIEVNDRYSQVQLKDMDEISYQANIPSDWEDFYLPEYLPNSYAISDTKIFGDSKIVFYQNPEGSEIQFSQSPYSDSFQVDTEEGKTEDIKIQGHQGLLVDKDGMLTLLWFDQDSTFFILGRIDKNDIIKMAESTKKEE